MKINLVIILLYIMTALIVNTPLCFAIGKNIIRRDKDY